LISSADRETSGFSSISGFLSSSNPDLMSMASGLVAPIGRIRAGALKAPYTPLRGLCRWIDGTVQVEEKVKVFRTSGMDLV
jgi:hypothetical protein